MEKTAKWVENLSGEAKDFQSEYLLNFFTGCNFESWIEAYFSRQSMNLNHSDTGGIKSLSRLAKK